MRPLVVNRPVDLPGLATVGGGFPTPIQFVGADVFPHHSLQDLLAVLCGLALENHLPIFEVANEIEVATLVVDPGLLPVTRSRVESGNAGTAQGDGISAGEIFLYDAAVHNAFDVVRAVPYFTRLVAGPSEVPVTNPELKLLLFRSSTRIRLCSVLLGGQKWTQKKEKSGKFGHGFRIETSRRRKGEFVGAVEFLVHLAA